MDSAAQEGQDMAAVTAGDVQDWLQARYSNRAAAAASAEGATNEALPAGRGRCIRGDSNGTVLRRLMGHGVFLRDVLSALERGRYRQLKVLPDRGTRAHISLSMQASG